MYKSKKAKAKMVMDRNMDILLGDDIKMPNAEDVLARAHSLTESYNVFTYDMARLRKQTRKYLKLSSICALFLIVVAGSVLFTIPSIRAEITGFFIKGNSSVSMGKIYKIRIDGLEFIESQEFGKLSYVTVYSLSGQRVVLSQEKAVNTAGINSDDISFIFEIETPIGTAHCVEEEDGYFAAVVIDDIKLTVHMNGGNRDLFEQVILAIE